MGLIGLVLIVLGSKGFIQLYLGKPGPLELNGQPSLLFFSLDDSCECVKKLIHSADYQIAHWSDEARGGIPVHRFDFDQNRHLADQYEVFRAPSLLLLDKNGRIVSRQDYPVIKNGPLDLYKFEMDIQTLLDKGPE